MPEKHLSEPWFSLVATEKKTIEGRLNKGDFKSLKLGDQINFYNDDFGFRRSVSVKVIKLYNFSTFREMLEKKGISRILPTVDSTENGVKIYRKYFSENDENTFSVLAIKIKKLKK